MEDRKSLKDCLEKGRTFVLPMRIYRHVGIRHFTVAELEHTTTETLAPPSPSEQMATCVPGRHLGSTALWLAFFRGIRFLHVKSANNLKTLASGF